MDKEGGSKDHEASEEDKPLKKARYMWEVKGKGYLKQGADSGPLMAAASVPDTASSSSRDRIPASGSAPGRTRFYSIMFSFRSRHSCQCVLLHSSSAGRSSGNYR